MKVIDSFLVALGFQVDDDSVKDANKSIEGIKTGALAMGAALASAMVAGGYAAKSTAGEIDSLNNSAKRLTNVGISQLDKLGFAINIMGGEAGEAAPLLENLESIITNYQRLGKHEAITSLAELNIPTEFVKDAKNSLELLRNIVEIMPQLEPDLQPKVAEIFGLGDGADLLARGGLDNLDFLMRRAEELATIDPQLVAASSDLTRSFKELARANDGLFRQFTKGAAPGITESINEWTQALAGMSAEAERLGNIFGFVSTMLSPEKVLPKKPTNKDEELEFMLFGSGYQRYMNFLPGYGPVSMGPRIFDYFSNNNPFTDSGPEMPPHGPAPTPAPVENSSSAAPYPALPLGYNNLLDEGRAPYFPMLETSPRTMFMDSVDSIVPETNVTNNSGRSMRIDRLEMSINGAGDPDRTADTVMERLNQAADGARVQFQTATAG